MDVCHLWRNDKTVNSQQPATVIAVIDPMPRQNAPQCHVQAHIGNHGRSSPQTPRQGKWTAASTIQAVLVCARMKKCDAECFWQIAETLTT